MDAEEILAALQRADDLEEAGAKDKPEADPADAPESNTMKAVREYGDSWKKRARDAEKRLAELEAAVAERTEKERRTTVETVFKGLELPDKQVDLFLKVHEGEVTDESIKQFVQDYGLKDLSGEGVTPSSEKEAGFQPGGGTGSVGLKTYEGEEAVKLAFQDPEAFEAARKQGRIHLDKLPGNEE